MNEQYKKLCERLNRLYTLSQFCYVEQMYDQMNDERKQAAQAIERLSGQRDELLAALENCRLLAARHRKEEWAQHILRFCESAGAIGSPLRSAAIAKAKGEPVALNLVPALADQPEGIKESWLKESQPVVSEDGCNTHPDAPHGFDRTASHSLGRCVCTCESWSEET